MKRLLLTASVFAAALPLFGQNFPLYLAGDFNGWAPNGTAMTDMGGGVWSATVSGLSAGQHSFKVTEGDWSWYRPNAVSDANSWLFPNVSGNATVSIDLSTHADGWTLNNFRISTDVDPGAWNAVGAWNGWNNADSTSTFTPLGGGIYELQKFIATPGNYGFKATKTGGWDYQIGADGRNENASELTFSTFEANQEVDMFLNAGNATLRVEVVPEPTTAALLGLGALVGIQSMKRRRK